MRQLILLYFYVQNLLRMLVYCSHQDKGDESSHEWKDLDFYHSGKQIMPLWSLTNIVAKKMD